MWAGLWQMRASDWLLREAAHNVLLLYRRYLTALANQNHRQKKNKDTYSDYSWNFSIRLQFSFKNLHYVKGKQIIAGDGKQI